MTQYADDLTLLLSDMNSVSKVLSTLKIFGECSGLTVNQEKDSWDAIKIMETQTKPARKHKMDK